MAAVAAEASTFPPIADTLAYNNAAVSSSPTALPPSSVHQMLASTATAHRSLLPPGSVHIPAKPRKNVLQAHGYTGQHVDGERRRNIEQMVSQRSNIAPVPFKSHGAKNPTFKRQFSVQTSHDGTIADPIGVNKPVVDKDGCPTTVHRGVTTIRKKFTAHGSSGTVLPNANRSITDDPDVTWQPCPYWAPNTVDEHNRFDLPPHEMRARDLAGNLRLGHPTKGGLFDPLVRRHAPDRSAIPTASQRAISARISSGRPKHQQSFTHSAPIMTTVDRGFMAAHPHHQHAHTTYANAERVVGATTYGIKFGFRADCSHNHAAWRRPKEATLMPTEAVRGTISMESVQSSDQMSFHQTSSLRAAQRTAQFAASLPPSDDGNNYTGPLTTATPLPVPPQ